MTPPACAEFARDRRGASAVEFALVTPLLVLIMFGIVHLGWAYHCANSVQFALIQASRQLMIDPGVDEDDVRATMEAFLDEVASADIAVAVDEVSINGVAFSRATAEYDHVVAIPLAPEFTLHFAYVQLAAQPDT